MSTPYPLDFQWNGEAMIPKSQKLADRQYVVGEFYRLVPHEERSGASHKHYFAAVHDAWQNLPDEMALQFPTSEHLRKFALIQAGYCTERTIACSSKEEARKIAAFVKPFDEFAIVIVRGTVIRVFNAKSQSNRAMNKKDFQDSKDKVLGIVSQLIGVKPAELKDQVGKAA